MMVPEATVKNRSGAGVLALPSRNPTPETVLVQCVSLAPQQGAFSRGPGPFRFLPTARRGTGCPPRLTLFPHGSEHGVTFAGCGVRATCASGPARKPLALLPPVRRQGF